MNKAQTCRKAYDTLGEDVSDDLEAVRRFAAARGFAVVDIVTTSSLCYSHPHLSLEQRQTVVDHINSRPLFDVRKDSGTLSNYLNCKYHLLNEIVDDLQQQGRLPADRDLDEDARITLYLMKLNDHLDGVIRRYPLPDDLQNPLLDRRLDQRGIRIHFLFKHNVTSPLRALIDDNPDAIDVSKVEQAAAWLDRLIKDPRFDVFLNRVYNHIGWRKANGLYMMAVHARDYLLSNS